MSWIPGITYLKYCPTPNQLRFHLARHKAMFRAVFCGKGAGKTICGLAEGIMYARAYPGSVGYVFSPNFPMMRRNIFPTLKTPYLLGDPLEHNPEIEDFAKIDNCLKFKNGSEIWFVSLDAPERAEGANIDWAYIDEARLIRDFDLAWKSVTSRLRGAGKSKVKNIPRGAWVTTTPDRPQSALWSIFEGPARSPSVMTFRWSIFENPKLDRRYIEEMVRLNVGGYAERFIYGRFADVSSGTLGFDYTKHVLTPDKMPKWRGEMAYGVDFGWTNPSAIVAVMFDSDGRAYVVDEFYQSRVRLSELVEAARQMRDEWGEGTFYCDPSEPGAIEDLNRAGVMAVGNATRREDGIREMGSRLKDAGDGRFRLYVDSRCVNLISELQTYDENVKENDHAVDALRYVLANRRNSSEAVFLAL